MRHFTIITTKAVTIRETLKLLFIFIGIGLIFSGISDTIATLYMGRMMRLYAKQAVPLEQEIKEITDKESK